MGPPPATRLSAEHQRRLTADHVTRALQARMPYRYQDDEVGRVVASCGGALGSGVTVRFERGVLEIRSGWRAGLVAWWMAGAAVTAFALGLATTIFVVLVHDRFLTPIELAASLLPAALVAAAGVASGRPRSHRIDGAARTTSEGPALLGAERGLELARTQRDRHTFDVALGVRGERPIAELHGVRAGAAARVKALAIAIASWLGVPLAETTTSDSMAALLDEDARLGLAAAASKEGGARKDRSPTLDKLEVAVDVATFALRLLEVL